MYEPKIFSWLVPGLLVPVTVAFALILNDVGAQGAYAGGCFVGVAFILAIQTAAGFRSYYRQIEVNQLVDRRRAMADTAEVRLFEASRGMHPEALRLLLKHRLEVWRIREMPSQELLLAVLDADPRVTLPFLEYVLRNSNPFSIMPKRLFSDKAFRFDPRGSVSDYEQYDALHALLERRGWLTAGFGNQPGQWIEPWNPELIARRFGVQLYEEDEEGKELEVSSDQLSVGSDQ